MGQRSQCRSTLEGNSLRLLIALEAHFLGFPDGFVYTSGPDNYAFWRSYLLTFEEVVILARVKPSLASPSNARRADGPNVTFARLPDYVGPREFLRNLGRLRSAVRTAVADADAYILRLPGAIGDMAANEIRRLGRKYAAEILGDPWAGLSPGTVRTPLRPVYRHMWTRNLRRHCRKAVAVHYVTRMALQRRYPPATDAYSCAFSDVSLDGYLADARTIKTRKESIRELGSAPGRPARLGFAGSMQVHYKGADVLLEAVAVCLREGLQLELHLIGDGRARPEYEALASKLGISKHTHFHGHLPAGKAVFDFLDSIDLFVMPSRMEGLPRAMVEAMARGCPCIGSEVGGIPELLPPDALVPPSDETALARAIERFVSDRDLMTRMIERNFATAQMFRPEVLREACQLFLTEVRTRSAASNSRSLPHCGKDIQAEAIKD